MQYSYNIQKKLPIWFKSLFFVVFFGSAVALYLNATSGSNIQYVVKKQLEKIREQQISQAYYEYTSKEFQKASSLDAFRKFIALYPVLLENKIWDPQKTQYTEENQGTIKGRLVSKDLLEMEGEWQLVKEEGEWKISGLRLLEIADNDNSADVDESPSIQPLIEKVTNQLDALKRQDFIDAYYGFVSKDFQKETPLLVFQEFLRDNPILSDYVHSDVQDARIFNDKGYVDLLLSNESLKYLLKYRLVHEGEEWKVFSLRVELPAEVAVQKSETNPEALIPPIRQFLESLSLNKSSDAYEVTSKEFKEETSYPNFKKFIASNPVLIDSDFADIREGEIESGVGKVRANLHGEQGITTIEFRLGFHEGNWQIWAMNVVSAPELPLKFEIKEEVLPIADQLIKTVSEWQTMIKQHLFSEAYLEVMSKNYQTLHSLKEFEQYLLTHSIFLDYRTTYLNRLLENGDQATVRGLITPYHGSSLPIRFDLVWEKENWKIDSAAILNEEEPIAAKEKVLDQAPPPPEPVVAPHIVSVIVSDIADEKGVIVLPMKVIPSNAERLVFNVQFADMLEKTQVNFALEHVESGSSAPTLSTLLEKEGESTVVFSYNSPKKGWPPGEYIAKAKTSSGQESILKFTIEEKK